MPLDTNNPISTNTRIPSSGTDNVVTMAERRQPSLEPGISGDNQFIVLTEPRPMIEHVTFDPAPRGTPIWAGLVSGMSKEEVQKRFPFLGECESVGNLTGECKLFGDNGMFSCWFDDEGGLNKLTATFLFGDFASAENKVRRLTRLWEGELFPADRVIMRQNIGVVQKGRLQVAIILHNCFVGLLVEVRITAVNPTSFEVEYENNVFTFHREIA